MHLTQLALSNFRIYNRLELEFPLGVTLIQGNNAFGKTSLLEAIFYLATAHSPHAGAVRELVRWGASEEPIPFARLEAHVAKTNDTRAHIEIVLVQAEEKNQKPNGRVSKRIKVNGIPKRAIDLLGELNVVLFLPDDLNLVFGSPSDRRRYLNITLAQIDTRYGRALSKYHQVLEQRNSLLRSFQERAFKSNELAIWDTQLIEQGAYLIARRAEAITRYNQIVADIHPRLTDNRESMRIVYQPSVATPTPPSPIENRGGETIETQFARQLETTRPREIRSGTTFVGPHRDDMRFWIDRIPGSDNPMDAITYASRGQGRTIALSLKLAEVELMREQTGQDPVLLLDDVMSELDVTRRTALAHTVMNASQAIITATDLSDFDEEFLSRARVMRMREGGIAT